MPLRHAKEVAEKVGNRLPYGRGSESARRDDPGTPRVVPRPAPPAASAHNFRAAMGTHTNPLLRNTTPCVVLSRAPERPLSSGAGAKPAFEACADTPRLA